MNKIFKKNIRYDFGRNWNDFSQNISEEQIEYAENAIKNLIPVIKGKTVIDIGCGSGLHALAFLRLGAKSITCIDYDENSIKTTSILLKRFYKNKKKYVVKQMDILSSDYLKNLSPNKFDIVYSWGVLHHTGQMFKAIDNTCNLVSENGHLAIALYIKTKFCRFWSFEKRLYSSLNYLRLFIKIPFFVLLLTAYVFKKRHMPWTVLKNYKIERGMSFYYDIDDWLGGYPYESVSHKEIISFLSKKNFLCFKHFNTHNRFGLFGSGCGQWIFKRKK